MKVTFAQLPGLQRAGKILELQEQINTHHRYATWLLQEFNILMDIDYQLNAGPDSPLKKRADQLQIVCEWHSTQAMYLQGEINRLQSPS